MLPLEIVICIAEHCALNGDWGTCARLSRLYGRSVPQGLDPVYLQDAFRSACSKDSEELVIFLYQHYAEKLTSETLNATSVFRALTQFDHADGVAMALNKSRRFATSNEILDAVMSGRNRVLTVMLKKGCPDLRLRQALHCAMCCSTVTHQSEETVKVLLRLGPKPTLHTWKFILSDAITTDKKMVNLILKHMIESDDCAAMWLTGHCHFEHMYIKGMYDEAQLFFQQRKDARPYCGDWLALFCMVTNCQTGFHRLVTSARVSFCAVTQLWALARGLRQTSMLQCVVSEPSFTSDLDDDFDWSESARQIKAGYYDSMYEHSNLH